MARDLLKTEFMKTFVSILRVFAAVTCVYWGGTQGSFAQYERSEIEVAMLLKLVSFTEWKDADPDQYTLGVFENREVYGIFESIIASSNLKNSINLMSVDRNFGEEALEGFHILYFANDEPGVIEEFLQKVGDRSILLAGNIDDFLELGGMVMINEVSGKLSFSIDVGKSRENGIQFRSKLLRLAGKVVGS